MLKRLNREHKYAKSEIIIKQIVLINRPMTDREWEFRVKSEVSRAQTGYTWMTGWPGWSDDTVSYYRVRYTIGNSSYGAIFSDRSKFRYSYRVSFMKERGVNPKIKKKYDAFAESKRMAREKYGLKN